MQPKFKTIPRVSATGVSRKKLTNKLNKNKDILTKLRDHIEKRINEEQKEVILKKNWKLIVEFLF